MESAAKNDASINAIVRCLLYFRRICDLCMEPRKPGGPKLYGRARTFVNADKQVDLRYLAELALKLYNDDKLMSFKLVKVCKINGVRFTYYGLTFRAQEDVTEECPVFRGVVHAVRGKQEASFCEIKAVPVQGIQRAFLEFSWQKEFRREFSMPQATCGPHDATCTGNMWAPLFGAIGCHVQTLPVQVASNEPFRSWLLLFS